MAVAAAVIITGAALFIYLTKNGKPAEGMIVQNTTIQAVITTSGQLSTQKKQTVYSPLNAQVKKIFVQDGQTVQEGDLLFTLDTQILESELNAALRKLENAQQQVSAQAEEAARKKAELAILQAQTGFAEYSSMQEAIDEYLQQQKLAEAVAVSSDIYPNAELADFEQQVAQLRQAVGKANVYAPMDGEVIFINLSDNTFLPQDAPVLQLYGQNSYTVTMRLQENEYRKVKIGQKVYMDAGVTGTVTNKKNILTPNDDGTLSGEATVTLASRPDSALMARVSVTLELGRAENTPAVPTLWVLHDNNGDYVYLVQERKVQKRYVEMGLSGGKLTQIVNGITQGDRVLNPLKGNYTQGERVNFFVGAG